MTRPVDEFGLISWVTATLDPRSPYDIIANKIPNGWNDPKAFTQMLGPVGIGQLTCEWADNDHAGVRQVVCGGTEEAFVNSVAKMLFVGWAIPIRGRHACRRQTGANDRLGHGVAIE